MKVGAVDPDLYDALHVNILSRRHRKKIAPCSQYLMVLPTKAMLLLPR